MDKRSKRSNNQQRKKQVIKGVADRMTPEEFEALQLQERVSLIQQLIPLGLMAVAKELNKEVEELVGAKYERKNGSKAYRHGSNPGTVRLGDKMVPISVPRVRDSNGDIQLESYKLLHNCSELDSESILKKVIAGVSSRRVSDVLPESVGSIGASKSSISKKFIKASTLQLKTFSERELSQWPIVAIFIDGTSFADDQMIIALGLCTDGSKRILGFVQSNTENSKPVAHMLRSLLDRGLSCPFGLLAIIDGSKGIRKAVLDVFQKKVLIQRCQWHKRENVISYLSKNEQSIFKKRLQKAYERPVYKEANAALLSLSKELSVSNISAQRSLEEGFEETLTLHKIDMFKLFGPSLKTTNCIESLNAQAKRYCKGVSYWKNSLQKQRWLATALLEAEKGFRKVHGYKNMPRLCKAVAKNVSLN